MSLVAITRGTVFDSTLTTTTMNKRPHAGEDAAVAKKAKRYATVLYLYLFLIFLLASTVML